MLFSLNYFELFFGGLIWDCTFELKENVFDAIYQCGPSLVVKFSSYFFGMNFRLFDFIKFAGQMLLKWLLLEISSGKWDLKFICKEKFGLAAKFKS